MVMKLELKRRKNTRLENYDYSSKGAYFITICVKERQSILWEGVNESEINKAGLPLSKVGKIVDSEINTIESFYINISIDRYVIMPNHIHMIIRIENDNKEGKDIPSISRIVQQFKGAISKKIKSSIWQKLFHDHIIRNEEDYIKICEYIDNNPINWDKDCYYKK